MNKELFKRFLVAENGATAVESGLIAAVVAVVLIAACGSLGDALSSMFSGNESSLGGAMENAVNSSSTS